MANPQPQHVPTDGLGTAAQITISGTNVTTLTPGRVYSVPLNVSGAPNPASVALTAAVKDLAGTAFTSGNANSVTWQSSTPAVATVAAGTVTAVAPGQTIIEARFPTFDNIDGVDFIYVQIIVQVGK